MEDDPGFAAKITEAERRGFRGGSKSSWLGPADLDPDLRAAPVRTGLPTGQSDAGSDAALFQGTRWHRRPLPSRSPARPSATASHDPAMRMPLKLCLLLLLLAQEAPAGKLIASKEPGWPQWRGPRRDGISDEKGLLQAWPAGGPKLLWKADGLGRAGPLRSSRAAPSIITGDAGEELRLFALDLDGKPKWTATNGKAWTGQYPGARSSFAFSDGSLFHMNSHGRVVCLDAATGRRRGPSTRSSDSRPSTSSGASPSACWWTARA